jgi:hypothetical protein
MAAKQTQYPGYEAHKRRMKARARALKRLTALHRPDFMRLFHEEQCAVEAEAEAARPPRLAVREATAWDDPALRWAGLPFSAPLAWLQDRAWEEAS